MKPIVLVHGMYFGGWCWRKVAAPLRDAGNALFTPSLTGCAERAHLSGPDITIDTLGRDVANLLRFEDLSDVTLVATSAGGMAVARAAELEPERIGHNPPLEVQRGYAERLNAEWRPLDSGHYPFFTNAAELACIVAARSH